MLLRNLLKRPCMFDRMTSRSRFLFQRRSFCTKFL
jgi:hypothetical protein